MLFYFFFTNGIFPHTRKDEFFRLSCRRSRRSRRSHRSRSLSLGYIYVRHWYMGPRIPQVPLGPQPSERPTYGSHLDAPLGCGSNLFPFGHSCVEHSGPAPAWHCCSASPVDGVQPAQA